MKNGNLVQTLSIENLNSSASQNGIFCVNSTMIWKLEIIPIDSQISELLQMNEFEEAKDLASNSDKSDLEKVCSISLILARSNSLYSIFLCKIRFCRTESAKEST